MKNTIITVAMAIMTLLLFSCNKDDQITKEDQTNLQEVETRAEGEDIHRIDYPTIEGLARFRDYNHFERFYSELTRIYDQSLDLYDEALSTYMNFNSVQFGLLRDVFSRPDDRYQPFITDPIYMAVLTKLNDFQIGDIYYSFINSSELIYCDVADGNTIQEIKSLQVNGNLSLATLPNKSMITHKDNLPNVVSPRSGCNCSTSVVYSDCDGYTFSASCTDDDGEPINMQGYITYVPQLGFDSQFVASGNGQFSVNVGFDDLDQLFIDNNTDDRTILFCINVDCGGSFINSICDDFRLNHRIGEGHCDISEQGEDNWEWEEVGNEAMSFRLAYYTGLFNGHEEAKIYSYRWVNNKWRTRSAALDVSVFAQRTWEDCISAIPFGSDDADCNNCRHKRARSSYAKSVLGVRLAHCDGDIEGSFAKTKGSISMSQDRVLEGFECCQ